MISIKEAWNKIQSLAQSLPMEIRPIAQAGGAVLAETVSAPVDLPPFDNSAMDGYALRAEDTAGASDERPVVLQVSGEVAAGGWREQPVPSGHAVKIMTGAPLPSGADTVLMLEAGRLRDGVVEVREPLPPGQHVRRRGEDIRRQAVLLKRGTRLKVQRLGLLAASGVAQVRVYRQPTVSVLATGSELVSAGSPLTPGKIYDSNRLVLRALVERTGAICDDLGVAADDPSLIAARVRAGLHSDLLLISGGVSVGEHDHVKSVLRELGVETLFWRVAMKPGKPLLCGRVGNTWVFGLPGNPISCVVGFLVFIEPLIRRLQGEEISGPVYRPARLTRAVRKTDERVHFLTARLVSSADGLWEVTPTEKQGSAMMQALAQANAFLVIPEDRMAMDAGELADVLPFDG